MDLRIFDTQLDSEKECKDMLLLLDHYAQDIMGGGEAISAEVMARLIPELKKRSSTLVVMAYIGEEPVGLAISFEGFSTFYAKPLLNIHDFVVREAYRGKGIAKKMLQKIESIAASRGYVKITLEVLQGNIRAQKVYFDFGFENYQLDEKMGHAVFLQKMINTA